MELNIYIHPTWTGSTSRVTDCCLCARYEYRHFTVLSLPIKHVTSLPPNLPRAVTFTKAEIETANSGRSNTTSGKQLRLWLGLSSDPTSSPSYGRQQQVGEVWRGSLASLAYFPGSQPPLPVSRLFELLRGRRARGLPCGLPYAGHAGMHARALRCWPPPVGAS